MATVTIKNIDRLTRKFNKIANMELEEPMKKAIVLVHGQAKELAPVDTGNLAGSIHSELNKRKAQLEGRVYTNLEYAPYVEFGTGIRGNGSYPYNIKGLDLTYHEEWAGMPAQPYMYPALKNNERTINNFFKDGVITKLKESCKGGR